MTSNIIGLLILLIVINGAILLGGSFRLFLNLPSMLIVIGITAGGLVYRFGFNWLQYIKSNTAARIRFCRYGKFLSGVSGFMGTLIGIVQIFANAEDFTRVGVAFSICFVASFYGVTLALVFHLVEKYDEKSGNNYENI